MASTLSVGAQVIVPDNDRRVMRSERIGLVTAIGECGYAKCGGCVSVAVVTPGTGVATLNYSPDELGVVT